MCILEAVERDVQLVHLAPTGRHVYSTWDTPNILKPQRGDMCIEKPNPHT